MDRRFHQRFTTDLAVVLTQLDNDLELTGQLEDISDSGICSLFPASLEPGAIVKLQILGLSLFGHIVYSNSDGGQFRTGVYVEPALLDSSNITELVQNYIIGTAERR
jgi:PilZ domain